MHGTCSCQANRQRNHREKRLAIFTGDEHNYQRVLINSDMDIYDPKYDSELPTGYKKLEIPEDKALWQLHSGAAGAPYYGLQKTPWNKDVKKGDCINEYLRVHGTKCSGSGKNLKTFTTENAVIFIHVNKESELGAKLALEVVNPDTLGRIE